MSESLSKLQKRARRWLIREDPTPDGFWENEPADADFIGAVRDNIRSFGPSRAGHRILDAARKAGWQSDGSLSR